MNINVYTADKNEEARDRPPKQKKKKELAIVNKK